MKNRFTVKAFLALTFLISCHDLSATPILEGDPAIVRWDSLPDTIYTMRATEILGMMALLFYVPAWFEARSSKDGVSCGGGGSMAVSVSTAMLSAIWAAAWVGEPFGDHLEVRGPSVFSDDAPAELSLAYYHDDMEDDGLSYDWCLYNSKNYQLRQSTSDMPVHSIEIDVDAPLSIFVAKRKKSEAVVNACEYPDQEVDLQLTRVLGRANETLALMPISGPQIDLHCVISAPPQGSDGYKNLICEAHGYPANSTRVIDSIQWLLSGEKVLANKTRFQKSYALPDIDAVEVRMVDDGGNANATSRIIKIVDSPQILRQVEVGS